MDIGLILEFVLLVKFWGGTVNTLILSFFFFNFKFLSEDVNSQIGVSLEDVSSKGN